MACECSTIHLWFLDTFWRNHQSNGGYIRSDPLSYFSFFCHIFLVIEISPILLRYWPIPLRTNRLLHIQTNEIGPLCRKSIHQTDTCVSLKLGKGMPTQTTARALLSAKSSPSLTLPRHTASISAPFGLPGPRSSPSAGSTLHQSVPTGNEQKKTQENNGVI